MVATLVHTVRDHPDGSRTEATLVAGSGSHVLTVRKDGAAPHEHVLPADPAHALLLAPALTGVGAREHVEITCADDATRALLVAALHDPDPLTPLDEDAWPDGAGPPGWDEYVLDEILSRRWLTIDGTGYHLLRTPGRTRAVAHDDGAGELLSGDELVGGTWTVDSDVTSSSGNDSLTLVGGDVLVGLHLGDLPEATLTVVVPDGIAAAVADWLADHLYATTFVLRVSGLPGLTGDERKILFDECLHQDLRIGLGEADRGAVLGHLCVRDTLRELRDALADPSSEAGKRLYERLRAIVRGDEAMMAFLEDHV